MPITRLEMISMAPKTQEASTQRQQEVNRPSAEQQNIAGSVQQQTRQKETQTTRLTNTKNDEQKYDAREGKGNSSYQSQERKKEQEKKEEEERKRMFGSTFDITI